MTSTHRDRIAATTGAVVLLGTLLTLATTPPPPQTSASAAKWTAYLHGHETGLVAASLAMAVVALALAVLGSRLGSAMGSAAAASAVPSLAIFVAVPLIVGGAVQAILAQEANRLGGSGVLALGDVTRALLYVVPALAAALFIGVVASAESGMRARVSVGIAVISGAAGIATLITTSAAAAGFGFAARLLVAGWAASAGLAERRGVAHGATPVADHVGSAPLCVSSSPTAASTTSAG